jgi:hypothetical protein
VFLDHLPSVVDRQHVVHMAGDGSHLEECRLMRFVHHCNFAGGLLDQILVGGPHGLVEAVDGHEQNVSIQGN